MSCLVRSAAGSLQEPMCQVFADVAVPAGAGAGWGWGWGWCWSELAPKHTAPKTNAANGWALATSSGDIPIGYSKDALNRTCEEQNDTDWLGER